MHADGACGSRTALSSTAFRLWTPSAIDGCTKRSKSGSSMGLVQMSVYPRACGGTLRGCDGPDRLILGGPAISFWGRVYPRACGGNRAGVEGAIR